MDRGATLSGFYIQNIKMRVYKDPYKQKATKMSALYEIEGTESGAALGSETGRESG